MPRRAKGPRLYLDKKRGQWVIRDGTRFIRTGCGERDGAEAEKYLAEYIAHKHKPEPSGAPLISDVVSVYGTEVAPSMKSARNIAYNISNLLKWWGDKTVAQITMKSCKAYAATRPSQAAAADLKILKVATDYWHRSEYGPLNFVLAPESKSAEGTLVDTQRGRPAAQVRKAHSSPSALYPARPAHRDQARQFVIADLGSD